jgi:hypothetical protein
LWGVVVKSERPKRSTAQKGSIEASDVSEENEEHEEHEENEAIAAPSSPSRHGSTSAKSLE